MEDLKEYSNGDVTIVWQPKLCIHSGVCARGLPNVFKPKEKPWIDQFGAPSDALTKQIGACPSGALSFYTNNTKGITTHG
ncbi:(4Fe-4S)-binding protein [Flavobacterium sp.]|uniref:(4Fe-4S)-binding protein n=1 Tax=Flavobacterium sp. TaxID=239 RepID=UPI0026323A15|nr:(4Fe-4S)-binding protein [Flavobacterium sp.]